MTANDPRPVTKQMLEAEAFANVIARADQADKERLRELFNDKYVNLVI